MLLSKHLSAATAALIATTSLLHAKPNIIFILADDLGYGEVGFNGQQKIKTPHLDQMAKDGAFMDNFYAGAPVCGPSRATLLYGLHTGHAPIRGNPRWTKSGKAAEMKSDDITLPTELKRAGYTTAVFASVAEGLACAVPGIPVSDWRRILERHAAPQQLRYAESIGFDLDRLSEVHRVVSPLALSPRVPLESRMIFGATADRLVPPDQVRDLWRHWEEPEIVWYEGTHVSFTNERDVWAGVDRTLRESGLALENR